MRPESACTSQLCVVMFVVPWALRVLQDRQGRAPGMLVAVHMPAWQARPPEGYTHLLYKCYLRASSAKPSFEKSSKCFLSQARAACLSTCSASTGAAKPLDNESFVPVALSPRLNCSHHPSTIARDRSRRRRRCVLRGVLP